ncbi:Outer membrane protein OmpA [Nannocystis exedens]|uniref:Outer membrane protein OmpA n=1 Tax=Nannocystis exedens TaxID=54 RepID=A0A1I1SZV1_9BACT|nr:OmpA family protein [Nannocystis exedens]PCC66878.1 Outer membrane porin F precursor [Nannocystis exedens]SFD51926.1 Outer membrane protein OmpA [Nannocystis exedens]
MIFARNPHRGNFRPATSGLKFALVASFALTATAPLAACGPTIFEDASALSVVGDPPPPPPKPKVVQEKPKRVVVEENRIKINEKIEFDFNKATIRPESDGLMAEIISVIKENPHIKKIAIEGHTSSEGSDKYNLKLSDKRAKAVMEYLVKKGGLPKEMFTAKGFGESKPLSDESTEEGKENNRRVEFNIVEQDVTRKRVAIDPESGEKTVIEEKTKTEADGSGPPPPPPPPAK